MKKVRVIYNLMLGKELIKKNLVDILFILEECGYEVSVFVIILEENLVCNEVYCVVWVGFDLLVVVGGDGIINEVVNGIVLLKWCFKMVIIFVGMMNDYVWVLKIFCDNIVKVVEVIKKN